MNGGTISLSNVPPYSVNGPVHGSVAIDYHNCPGPCSLIPQYVGPVQEQSGDCPLSRGIDIPFHSRVMALK
jgi:hypothetical protein